MNFRQMMLGWQRGTSVVAQLLAMRAIWAWLAGGSHLVDWPAGEAVLIEWTEN